MRGSASRQGQRSSHGGPDSPEPIFVSVPEEEPIDLEADDASQGVDSRSLGSLPSPQAPSTESSRTSIRPDGQRTSLGGASDHFKFRHGHGGRSTINKAQKAAKGEIRFPVVDVEPTSPRIVLPGKRVRQWQDRIVSKSGKPPDDEEDEKADVEPPLEWYAEQLLHACGRALIPATTRVLALQARHNAGVVQLDAGEQLWHLLFEVAGLFAAADYHVHRAAEVLSREVSALFLRRGSTGSGGVGGGDGPSRQLSSDNRLPMPPFAPKGADGALADLHLHVARLQRAGPQLAATFRRLLQGMAGDAVLDIHRLLEALPARGSKGAFGSHSFAGHNAAVDEKDHPGRLQTLFMVVPCIEEAIERLGTLVCLAERSQAVSAGTTNGKKSRKPKSGNGEIDNDDEDFIQDDDDDDAGVGDIDVIAEDSQDLVEAAAIAEAPKPSAKARVRPVSAGRTRPGSAESPMVAQPSRQEENESNPSPQAPREASKDVPAESSEKVKAKKPEARGGQPPAAPKTRKKKG